MVNTRRQAIQVIGACSLPSLAWAQDKNTVLVSHLVAAWAHETQNRLGVLRLDRNSWSVVQALNLPTRPHGFICEADGRVLAVARRPGEWLLRWNWRNSTTQWSWVDDDRRLNGHVVSSQDGFRRLTTETDQGSGQGLLGVRDALTLEKLQEFDTHGMDPHQSLILPRTLGRLPAGSVVVANGGLRTFAETGRTKPAGSELNSSLVVLSPSDGKLLGQWRLPDPYLSIRHLAWDVRSSRLGIALQAEHPHKSAREAAPVLAVWDGESLALASAQPQLQGYGGDIVALPSSGFAVSCPKANAVGLFDAGGRWTSTIPQSGVCALSQMTGTWYAAGTEELVAIPGLSGRQPSRMPSRHFRWDNHWIELALSAP